MFFQSPEWFLLLPILLVAGWFWKSLRLWSPLRAACCLCAVLALTDPRWRKQDDALDLWLLLDRSESTEDLVDKGLPEWRRLLEKAMPSPRHDRIRLIDFAAEVVEHGSDGTTFTGSRRLTRTNLALQNIAALAEENRPARILLFTDGYATEPLHEATAQLEARGIPLDFRLIREESEADSRIARIEIPERVQAGEPFLLAITVRGTNDGKIPLVIRRSGQTLAETSVTLVNGVGKAEFTDRIPRPGAFEYEAEIIPSNDAHPGNNRASRWIETTGGPRVILATQYTDDPLAKALSSLDFTVDLVSDLAQLKPGRLAGARAVILNNVPAYEVPAPFLSALDFFVREQAGGLLMAGGEHSFGSGGYFESAIDPLLPVSMELKTEYRKLAVSLAIVMDRSGSMSVTVPAAGGKTLAKMDLVDAGTANSIELLGAMDQVAVIAVDSAPQTIVPLSRVENHKPEMIARVRKVRSEGGGIFIYEGLKAAWDALKKAETGTRHVILFADANDSEEPGDYKNLLKTMTDNGVTVTVIGMGSKADTDAKLLEDIAKLGNGRIFFTDKPVEIPKIFAQETVTIARSAFVKDPVGAKATGRWTEVSPKPIDFLPKVGGYNLSYARDDATTHLVTTDEYLAPLVAHARRGLGRTAAVSFPLGGDYSAESRTWPAYADFSQTLTRWLMGLELPPGIGLRHQVDGTRLTIDLLYDTALWADKLAAAPPKLRLLESGTGDAALDVPWKRIAPGRFSVSRDLEAGAVVRGAVQVGPHALPFGPVTVGSSVEWEFDPERLAELRAAAAQTGGRELLDLSKAWLRPSFTHDWPLRMPLALCLLGTLLAEALLTRTGWRLPLAALPRLPRLRLPARRPKPVREPKAAAHDAFGDLKQPAPPAPPADDDSQDSVARRSRYQRAKDRR